MLKFPACLPINAASQQPAFHLFALP